MRAGRGGTFLIGGGKYNTTHDNIFIDCGLAFHLDDRLKGWAKGQLAPGGLEAQRYRLVQADQPPYSIRYPRLGSFWQDDPATPADPVERNLLVRCRQLTNGQGAWGPFRDNWETGDDPGFVDLAGGDYRLRPGAEAFRRIPGFRPGDVSQMGLVGSIFAKVFVPAQESRHYGIERP